MKTPHVGVHFSWPSQKDPCNVQLNTPQPECLPITKKLDAFHYWYYFHSGRMTKPKPIHRSPFNSLVTPTSDPTSAPAAHASVLNGLNSGVGSVEDRRRATKQNEKQDLFKKIKPRTSVKPLLPLALTRSGVRLCRKLPLAGTQHYLLTSTFSYGVI